MEKKVNVKPFSVSKIKFPQEMCFDYIRETGDLTEQVDFSFKINRLKLLSNPN